MPRRKTNNSAQRRERRRYPFNANTPLCSFITSASMGKYISFIRNIEPWLRTKPQNMFSITFLDFDIYSLKGKREALYMMIAELLKKDSTLRVSKSIFYRYICHAEHSNLEISESYLKRKVCEITKSI